MVLPIAFSPCPNDTFLFHAWATGHLKPIVDVTLADVQQLNEWALLQRFALTKVSLSCLGHLLPNYVLLPVGCALGHQCGPKIIAESQISLTGKRIAVPGKHTTANFLLDTLLDEHMEKVFCTYDQVADLIKKKHVDCGLIIHESRFTFQQQGFVELADLGTLWEDTYHLPLPLGGIVAKRSLGRDTLDHLTATLQSSLKAAHANPQSSLSYVFYHSIEKKRDVVEKHINLYVNDETTFLSEKGRLAIETLLSLGRQKGLIPNLTETWLHG